jgi:hypothetical protein
VVVTTMSAAGRYNIFQVRTDTNHLQGYVLAAPLQDTRRDAVLGQRQSTETLPKWPTLCSNDALRDPGAFNGNTLGSDDYNVLDQIFMTLVIRAAPSDGSDSTSGYRGTDKSGNKVSFPYYLAKDFASNMTWECTL